MLLEYPLQKNIFSTQIQDASLVIDFLNTSVLSSEEVTELFLIYRQCALQQKRLSFKIISRDLAALLRDMGFEDLGVMFLS